MKRLHSLLIVTSFLASGLAPLSVVAQDSNPAQATRTDNTQVNVRDRNSNEPTADQAQNNPSDRELMQKIRQSVMADKSLSTYAQNVKIIAQRGTITLKGPVRSEAERKNLVDKAAEAAGPGKVTDELSIASDSDQR